MKAKVKMVPTYQLEVNGKIFKDFHQAGEWEGMMKLENDDGVVILDNVDASSFESILGSIFEPGKEREVYLVKATHVFIHTEKGGADAEET
jgi:hypothetical protein